MEIAKTCIVIKPKLGEFDKHPLFQIFNVQ